MKIRYLKLLVILSFLIITIPSPHVVLPMYVIAFLQFIDISYSIFSLNFPSNMNAVYAIFLWIGIVLLCFRNFYISLSGHILLIALIFVAFQLQDLSNAIFITTFLVHFILSGFYYYKTFVGKRKATAALERE